jgi:hypothetical protein
MRCYSHLSDDEREQISLAKALGHSIGARRLDRLVVLAAVRFAGVLCRTAWIAAKEAPVTINRRYRPGTLILETEFKTDTGCAVIIDFMPPADGAHLVRIVAGRLGRVV